MPKKTQDIEINAPNIDPMEVDGEGRFKIPVLFISDPKHVRDDGTTIKEPLTEFYSCYLDDRGNPIGDENNHAAKQRAFHLPYFCNTPEDLQEIEEAIALHPNIMRKSITRIDGLDAYAYLKQRKQVTQKIGGSAPMTHTPATRVPSLAG
ncbi:MAG: hypothetical protein KGJ13_02140 [Patescibacteria group bacterium]|nr:hypothetical protein [Patescibacteria group bacterium]